MRRRLPRRTVRRSLSTSGRPHHVSRRGADARTIVRNDGDGRVYTCTITLDSGCSVGGGCPGLGQVGTVGALGLQYGDGRCTGSDIGSMDVEIPSTRETLTLQCGIVPVCLP